MSDRRPEEAILGVVGPRGVVRMLARLRARDPSARPILLVPEIDAWRFADGISEVWPTGEEHLELDPGDLSRRLLSAGVSRILVPLGLPRRQLVWVARWAAAERRLGFSLTCGSRRLESRSAVVLSLLALTALVRVPLSVALRLGRRIDGLMMVSVARLLGVLPRRRTTAGAGVCHVITHVGTGGAQRQLHEYLRWAARGEAAEGLRVVALFGGNRAFLVPLRRTGVPVEVLEDACERSRTGRALLELFPNLSTMWHLRCRLRAQLPACVYGWLFLANVAAALAGRSSGVGRIIASELTLNRWKAEPGTGRWWYRAADRASSRLWDEVVTNSAAAAADLAAWTGLPRGAIRVIYNGLDLDALRAAPAREVRALHGIRADEQLILTVGRLAPEKDHDLLLRAAAALARSDLPFRVVIVGHGALEESLRWRTADLGIEPRVVFAGRVDDPQSYYRAADLFVLTSRIESFPNAILEAQAFAVPVVSTDVGGVREMIVPGVTGILLEIPAGAAALAGALRHLLDDPAARSRLGAAGRERVDAHFGIEHMGRAIAAITKG